MSDPITLTASTLVAIAASNFIEATASKTSEVVTSAVLQRAGTQVDQLWQRIKQHFVGDKKAEKAIAQVESERSDAALIKLEVYLDDELSAPDNQALRQDLQQIAQQIINLSNHSQERTGISIEVDAKDNARVVAAAELHAQNLSLGDGSK